MPSAAMSTDKDIRPSSTAVDGVGFGALVFGRRRAMLRRSSAFGVRGHGETRLEEMLDSVAAAKRRGNADEACDNRADARIWSGSVIGFGDSCGPCQGP
jgi:hypothetical protein